MQKFSRLLFITTLITVVFSSNAFAFFGKNKFEKEVTVEASAVKLTREVVKGKYQLVTAAELKKWIDQNKQMVIVDTMPYESSYKKNHVPGAVQFLFPIPEMTAWDNNLTGNKSAEEYEALLGNDKEKIIVVYCGFVKCTRSHNGALWAVEAGYKNVYRFAGGIFAWIGADYPVSKVD